MKILPRSPHISGASNAWPRPAELVACADPTESPVGAYRTAALMVLCPYPLPASLALPRTPVVFYNNAILQKCSHVQGNVCRLASAATARRMMTG